LCHDHGGVGVDADINARDRRDVSRGQLQCGGSESTRNSGVGAVNAVSASCDDFGGRIGSDALDDIGRQIGMSV
jgi:uncharacterized protein YidB (DUF937 family)